MSEIDDDLDDRIEADFIGVEMSSNPAPYNPHRQMLQIIDRCIALLDRIIDENGLKS